MNITWIWVNIFNRFKWAVLFSHPTHCTVYGPDHRGHGTACEPKKFGVASWPGVVSDIVTVAKDVCFLLHVYDYYDGIFLEYWSNKSGGKVWESGDGISIAYTPFRKRRVRRFDQLVDYDIKLNCFLMVFVPLLWESNPLASGRQAHYLLRTLDGWMSSPWDYEKSLKGVCNWIDVSHRFLWNFFDFQIQECNFEEEIISKWWLTSRRISSQWPFTVPLFQPLSLKPHTPFQDLK